MNISIPASTKALLLKILPIICLTIPAAITLLCFSHLLYNGTQKNSWSLLARALLLIASTVSLGLMLGLTAIVNPLLSATIAVCFGMFTGAVMSSTVPVNSQMNPLPLFLGNLISSLIIATTIAAAAGGFSLLTAVPTVIVFGAILGGCLAFSSVGILVDGGKTLALQIVHAYHDNDFFFPFKSDTSCAQPPKPKKKNDAEIEKIRKKNKELSNQMREKYNLRP